MSAAIAAFSCVTAHGVGLEAFEGALRRGETAIKPISRFSTEGLCSTVGAECSPTDAGALLNAALDQIFPQVPNASTRRGVLLASTKGELPRTLAGQSDAFSALLSLTKQRCGALGPSRTVGAACASATFAVGMALSWLDRGCDEVVVAAVEALHPFIYAGFHSLKALSPKSAAPFDAERKGLSLGEAAAVLVLRKSTDCQPLVHLDGFGAATDAYDQTAPHPEAEGLVLACRQALEHAQLRAEQIDRYQAHGTGTVQNDQMEARALKRLFGDRRVPVTAIKGSVGHTLGAAGALDLIACALSLERGELWPICGLSTLDPALDIDAVTSLRASTATRALLGTAGFGGLNAALVVRRAE